MPGAGLHAVNTAARMEQTTAPRTIQISSTTRSLLPAEIPMGLTATGGVAMKAVLAGREGGQTLCAGLVDMLV